MLCRKHRIVRALYRELHCMGVVQKSSCKHASFRWNSTLSRSDRFIYNTIWTCASKTIFSCARSSEICIIPNMIKCKDIICIHKLNVSGCNLEIVDNMSGIITKTWKSCKSSTLRDACAFGALFFDIWHAANQTNNENVQWTRNACICRVRSSATTSIIAIHLQVRNNIASFVPSPKLWNTSCSDQASTYYFLIFPTLFVRIVEIITRLKKYVNYAPLRSSFVGNLSAAATPIVPA